MAEIMRAVQRDAAAEGLLDESVFMVQPWLDAPRACWKLTAVVAADASVSSARDLLARHAQEIWERRAEFRVTKVPVADAVDAVAAHPGGVPLLLADGGDSPSAGSAGDSTDLLAALIASSDPRPRLAIVADAAAAKEAIVAGVGTEVTLSAGASSSDFTPPATLTGRVALVDDGFYTAIYPAGPVSVGPTVVVDVGPTTVVITSKPANMLDQEIYRHLGIDPAGFHAVQVKSAGGFRALWSDVSTVIVYVDSRGASDSTLKRLPYTRIRPGLWPFTPPSSPSK
jgi:microcystin degradation protein MlrC